MESYFVNVVNQDAKKKQDNKILSRALKITFLTSQIAFNTEQLIHVRQCSKCFTWVNSLIP